MDTDDFLREFAGILEIDAHALSDRFVLSELPTWDSLSFLAIIMLVNRYFKIEIEGCILSQCRTMKDFFKLIGKN